MALMKFFNYSVVVESERGSESGKLLETNDNWFGNLMLVLFLDLLKRFYKNQSLAAENSWFSKTQ